MWSVAEDQIEIDSRLVRLKGEGKPLSFGDVLQLWWSSEEFRKFFLGKLKGCPYEAFRWETPPLTRATLERPFEYVLLDCPGLVRRPDREAFAEHFKGGMTVTFSNLSGDSTLIAPAPLAAEGCYGHLAAFVREAPEVQAHALLQSMAEAMQARLSNEPVWLSTAGMGVAWLHVRLDDRPKYYGHTPYKAADR